MRNIYVLGAGSLGLASLAATATQIEAMPSMRGPGQPYPLGKGVRTSTSKYMPHHGKSVFYFTNSEGQIKRIKH